GICLRLRRCRIPRDAISVGHVGKLKRLKWGFPKKIVAFRHDAGIVTDPSGTMITAAPDGAPPRRNDDYSKNHPARRASERP
ncbi:MAG: hypothetical protein MUO95_02530, partial [Methanoregula sp.]|nr:hypothetical protein [Methanoregula sp.]